MITLLIFLAVLSVLVFVHEFGHFITAKRAGVRVHEFGFGFPPRLVGWQRGVTVYSLNAIPIGGFVRLKGESGEDAGDRDSYAGQSLSRRAAIVAAGVAMNGILAAALMTAGFGVGLPALVDNAPRSARIRDVRVYAAEVLPGTPAERAGLAPGDELVELAGERVVSSPDFQRRVQLRPGQPLRLAVFRGGERKEFMVTPEVLSLTNKPGIGVGLVATGIISYAWYEAPYRGIIATAAVARDIVQSFGALIAGFARGRVAVDFSGPVGIAVITGEVARLGFASLIQFVALLSVNLAVVNLIPFPALDGGRLLFIILEKLRGRPVPKRWENLAHQIGFAFLIALIALVTARDIGRFGGPFVAAVKRAAGY